MGATLGLSGPHMCHHSGSSITHQRYPNIPWANTSLVGAIAVNPIRLYRIGIMFGCSRIISVAILFKSNFNSDIRLEQGGTKKTKAKSKRNPAKFQLNTIKNHFITKAKDRR